MILDVKGLSKDFGGLRALASIDLCLEEGEVRGLIGPNGAGKTTFFNVLSGYFRPSAGEIKFLGKDIVGLKPNKIAELGLVRTFQETTLFHGMTVQENIVLGFHLQIRSGFFSTLFKTSSQRTEEKRLFEKSLELIEFMGMGELKDELAINLPHGHQRALAIAIALASKPRLLLLDEPVTGMNPKETADMVDRIKKIRDEMGVTIIIIEHDMKAIVGLSDKLTVLNYGMKIIEGTPHDVIEDKDVIEAYLGAEEV